MDVRLLAATHRDLRAMVKAHRFREDLYYRLDVLHLVAPPLRERQVHIPVLVEAFLGELARANALRPKRIHRDALEAIKAYHWPGNVRELKNVLESVLVSSPREVITVEDLPPALVREARPPERPEVQPGTTLAEVEALLIRRTLEHTGGYRTYSAQMLGIGHD